MTTPSKRPHSDPTLKDQHGDQHGDQHATPRHTKRAKQVLLYQLVARGDHRSVPGLLGDSPPDECESP